MTDLPANATAVLQAIAAYSARWWAAVHCRPGDRIVEITDGMNTLVPFLLAQGARPQSLTVLGPDDLATRPGLYTPWFPVTYRRWVPSLPWPVAGPLDLVVDVDTTETGADAVPRTLRHGAPLLSLEGRIVTTVSAAAGPPRTVVGTVLLLLDSVSGLVIPDDGDLMDREIRAGFGDAALDLVRELHRRGPSGIDEPVDASVLGGVSAGLLYTYRRTR